MMTDFFVSYNRADQDWAEWIAWQLEAAGYTTVLQAWDFRPGHNFAIEMHTASTTAERVIAVLSPGYLKSEFTAAEWAPAFAEDPAGTRRLILPVRVKPCKPEGLLRAIGYIDLIGRSEETAREALLNGVLQRRAKPSSEPAFPGESGSARPVQPPFPGGADRERPAAKPESGLPAQFSTFIGREAQVGRTVDVLLNDDVRLVSLSGPGGIGKTRLALKVAADVRERFQDGVWFVRLAPIDDPSLVVQAIADVLEVRQTSNAPVLELLKAHLHDKRLLLVLDSFEHVMDAAPVVPALLSDCSGLKIMLTSRQALAIPGERVLAVPPLELPLRESFTRVHALAQFEAIRLFVERASEKSNEFTITDANAHAVVEICRRLDGLPLAIELAAARAGSFGSPVDLLTRLEKQLDGGKSKAPVQPQWMQTMRTSIAWSYDLLPREEGALFRRLAVFSGGFTLDGAEAVCASIGGGAYDVQDGLISLFDKSLVRLAIEAGVPRYRMLRTIREFGLEQLEAAGEGEDARVAHAAYYIAFAEEAEHELAGEAQAMWLDRLDAERDNVRAAMDWTLKQADPQSALALAANLRPFWQTRGYLSEGSDLLERALANGQSAAPALRAKALFGLGRLAYDLGEYAQSLELFEESLSLRRRLEDRQGIAESLTNVGFAIAARGDSARARSLHEEALAISRGLGDKRGIAESLYRLGDLMSGEGEYDAARRLYLEALTNLNEQTDPIRIAYLHYALGVTSRLEGDGDAAGQSIEKSLSLFQQVGDKMGVANALIERGHVARLRGDGRFAERSYTQALIDIRQLGSQPGMVEGLEALASVAAEHGRTAHAAKLLGAATRWRAFLNHPFYPTADRVTQERLVSTLRQSGPVEFVQGDTMSLDQAVAESLSELTFPETDAPDR